VIIIVDNIETMGCIQSWENKTEDKEWYLSDCYEEITKKTLLLKKLLRVSLK
jgi:hypothetical protein